MRFLNYFIVFFALVSCKTGNRNLKSIQGDALGTTFHIRYIDIREENFTPKVDSLVKAINRSLSTYIPTSDISKINNGDTTIVIDPLFQEVMQKSKKVFDATNGAFDPTVGILVNAWGFGPGKQIANLDSAEIKSLMKYVGFNKVQIKNGKVVKDYPQVYLDFNAIAKGYLVDMVGRMFEKNNIQNYLVEIGGEIRARGENEEGKGWNIAIEYPNEDGTQSFITTLRLHNESMATSGNYRKYRRASDGRKYVHEIDPKTGYANPSNLLSASAISKSDCADVDGYATAFMVMGFEKAKAFLEDHKNIDAYLIYVDKNGKMQTYQTTKFEQ